MTSVSGHLTELALPPEFKDNWMYPPPDRIFDAPVSITVPDVGTACCIPLYPIGRALK